MSERDIEFLLDLYKQQYVRGEKKSSEARRKIRHESKRKNRHLLFDSLYLEAQNEKQEEAQNEKQETFDKLLIESKPFILSSNQIELIRYLIDDFNNKFKQLHGQAKEETIILAFMFFVKKVEEPRTKVRNWAICTKYGLTEQVFEIVLCRLLIEFMKRCPIRPVNYTRGDHDVLVRGGKR